MSDYGDFCREQRERRSRVRMFWNECPTCAIAYGTGTKVAPGDTCYNCGWKSPGQIGDDKRALRRSRKDDFRERQAEKTKNKKRNDKLVTAARTCRTCGKVLGSKRGRIEHENAKHPKSDAEGES